MTALADGIPLERVFVFIETDHTGVIDAGDTRAHAAARDAQFGLANLAQAAQIPTAAAARAFLGAQMGLAPAPPAPCAPFRSGFRGLEHQAPRSGENY